jgi:uncharacterized protein YbbK (DUF523 family)
MILVSACLAGFNCRYDGKNCFNKDIFELVQKGMAIPVCPEVMGGLETPRNPIEINISANGEYMAVDNKGFDKTEAMVNGAKKCLNIAKIFETNIAILKSKSPSCGFGEIYDGSFTGKVVEGKGFAAKILSENNITIMNENNYNLKDLIKG